MFWNLNSFEKYEKSEEWTNERTNERMCWLQIEMLRFEKCSHQRINCRQCTFIKTRQSVFHNFSYIVLRCFNASPSSGLPWVIHKWRALRYGKNHISDKKRIAVERTPFSCSFDSELIQQTLAFTCEWKWGEKKRDKIYKNRKMNCVNAL